jgi:hypothetical protein
LARLVRRPHGPRRRSRLLTPRAPAFRSRRRVRFRHNPPELHTPGPRPTSPFVGRGPPAFSGWVSPLSPAGTREGVAATLGAHGRVLQRRLAHTNGRCVTPTSPRRPSAHTRRQRATPPPPCCAYVPRVFRQCPTFLAVIAAFAWAAIVWPVSTFRDLQSPETRSAHPHPMLRGDQWCGSSRGCSRWRSFRAVW